MEGISQNAISAQKALFQGLLLRYNRGEVGVGRVLYTFRDLIQLGYGEWAWSEALEIIQGKKPSKLHEFQEERCLNLLATELIKVANGEGGVQRAGFRIEGGKVTTYGMFPKSPRRMCTCARR